jgi:hypothetical protein
MDHDPAGINMSTMDRAAIETFIHGQVASWNAHDRETFMAWYRRMAPRSLVIEYVGREDQREGWFVIEEMWDKHNAQITLEVVVTIINGHEAAVHHRNRIVGTDAVIESIETYRFEPAGLFVRYFLLPPADKQVNLNQFRGLAGTEDVTT